MVYWDFLKFPGTKAFESAHWLHGMRSLDILGSLFSVLRVILLLTDSAAGGDALIRVIMLGFQ